MIRYKLTEPPPRIPFAGFVPEEAFVILRTNALSEWVPVEFEGASHLIMVAKSTVLFSSNADKRDDGSYWLSAIKLHEGMHQPPMKVFKPTLVEGNEILGIEK